MGLSVKIESQSRVKESDGSSDDIDEKKGDDSVEVVTFRERLRERLVRWGRRVNPFYVDDPPPVPDSDAGLIPEVTANWFERLTFGWLAPLMLVISAMTLTDTGKKGYRRPLQKEDLWHYDDPRLAATIASKLQQNIDKRIAKGKGESKYLLLFSLIDTFFWQFWFAGFLQFFGVVLGTCSPLIMKNLINFADEAFVANRTGTPGPSLLRGMLLAIALTAMQVTSSLSGHHYMYNSMMAGAQSRTALTSLAYRKSLVLSNKARLTYTNGRITNLMSTDSGRIDDAAGYIHQSWTTVIQFGLDVTLLVINLGYSAFAGIVLLVVAVPLLAKVVRALRMMRRRANLFTDARIRAIQEILSTIRAIKFYTWEQSFIKKVVDLRMKELKLVRTAMILRNATNGFAMCLPLYASILAFITYSATGNSLKAGNVFSSLTLFDMLRGPLMFVPRVATSMVDAWVALGRIQRLLTADELEPPRIDYKHEYAVSVENGSFIWERVENRLEEHEQGRGEKAGKGKQKKQREWGSGRHGMMTEEDKRPKKTPNPTFHSIQDTSFNISRCDLVIIVGEIGSGKSSLLSALVNEMRRASGSLTIGGRIAYCPQTAWIRNATLRENILFDKQYDAKWYDQVVSDCALEPDIEMLPAGDLTEIGERGVTLSGGQKARINMARAAYSDADIYLLDDPLSAVDAHVGHHLVERVICGSLADKTRILVTNQLQILSRAKADAILCLKDGKIVESGTYEELVAGDGEFSRLLRKYTREDVDIERMEEKDAPEAVEQVVKTGRRGNTLMEKEDRLIGSIPWRVYTKYARLGGGIWIIPGVLLAVAISNGVNVMTGVWLSAWTGDRFHLQKNVYIAVYAALGFSQAFFIFFYGFILTMTGNRATSKMHSLALNRVIRAPMSFFDTTPLGRIINRFSKDVDTMDNRVSDSYRMFLQTFTIILATLCLIVSTYYWFILALAPLACLFIWAAKFYRATAREVKRLDAILRSHVYSHFGESLTGLITIRAYGKQQEFSTTHEKAIDVMNRAYFITIVNQRWLGVRLDFVGYILILIVSTLTVTQRFSVAPAVAGLILSYCVQSVGNMGQTTRQFAELENNMNSTERVHHYASGIEKEAPFEIPERKPAITWPEKGEIVMKDVYLNYRANLPYVLNGLSVHINGGERIGIVGRTGAGKSSILVALFRLVELVGGSITIDGLDISQLGLYDLRSVIAIIPQDPVLFKGTIRSNLDPFSQVDDSTLYQALRRVHLLDDKTPDGNATRFTLEEPVGDEGANFSLGQRQLLAMARALVRQAKIIVMDEATSSVDYETDSKIQITIKQEFKGATLLTIAHRLHSIINYDRVVVMSDGKVIEFDTPSNLYDMEDGSFRSLCDKASISREDICGEEVDITTQ